MCSKGCIVVVSIATKDHQKGARKAGKAQKPTAEDNRKPMRRGRKAEGLGRLLSSKQRWDLVLLTEVRMRWRSRSPCKARWRWCVKRWMCLLAHTALLGNQEKTQPAEGNRPRSSRHSDKTESRTVLSKGVISNPICAGVLGSTKESFHHLSGPSVRHCQVLSLPANVKDFF